ncbi:MAG: SLC13 family permease, partial [Dialister sp.]|nr:SLC13 family permease [Dialister sp.]
MSLIRRNPDLAAAMLLALVTACFSDISFSSLHESINFPLLALLFSLMTIVAALRRAGFFSGLFCHLFQKPMNSRRMGQVFLFLSFFTSMVFTNDVSLIIFVPLAISLFKEAHALRLVIPVLTWMTIAANLGSMLTPIGNPQNLFIY